MVSQEVAIGEEGREGGVDGCRLSDQEHKVRSTMVQQAATDGTVVSVPRRKWGSGQRTRWYQVYLEALQDVGRLSMLFWMTIVMKIYHCSMTTI